MDETWVTPDDNTCFAHKDDNAILQPSAVCAFRACEQTVLHRCVVSGCPVHTLRRFSEIPFRKPNPPPFLR